MKLKIAGKYYADGPDSYWQQYIAPAIDDGVVEHSGYIKGNASKANFLGNAKAVIMPSVFDEPFGMVAIEALACGTPVIGLNSGALPEVISDDRTGIIVDKAASESVTVTRLAKAIRNVSRIKRAACRSEFEQRFTIERMAREHKAAYDKLNTTVL